MGLLDDVVKGVAGGTAGQAGIGRLGQSLGLDLRTSAALAVVMPLVVDKLTPHGSVPSQQSLLQLAAGLLGSAR